MSDLKLSWSKAYQCNVIRRMKTLINFIGAFNFVNSGLQNLSCVLKKGALLNLNPIGRYSIVTYFSIKSMLVAYLANGMYILWFIPSKIIAANYWLCKSSPAKGKFPVGCCCFSRKKSVFGREGWRTRTSCWNSFSAAPPSRNWSLRSPVMIAICSNHSITSYRSGCDRANPDVVRVDDVNDYDLRFNVAHGFLWRIW